MERVATWPITLSAALVALVAVGCETAVPEPLPVAVQVETLAPRVVCDEMPYSAALKERQRVALSFKVPGTVKELLHVRATDGTLRDVQEGDRVEKGTTIAQLDDTDYRRDRDLAQERLAQARARLEAARATAENAAREFDRSRRLAQRNMVPPQELDASEARHRAAAAELTGAERDVRSCELLLNKAEDDLANCSLRVPIEGAVVIAKEVEPFERVAAARPVFVVLDTSLLKAVFGVPDTQVGRISVGQPVEVTADALGGGSVQGRVGKVAPAADETTRTFLVEVWIDAPGVLRPGMIVTTRIGTPREVVSLPLAAVRRGEREGVLTVYEVVSRDGTLVAIRRPVEIDGLADDRVIVRPGGQTVATAGARIVVDGAERLHDGQRVRVLDGPTQLSVARTLPPIR